MVVDDVCEVVGREAVGLQDGRSRRSCRFSTVISPRSRSMKVVVPLVAHREADDVRFASRRPRQRASSGREVAAVAVVAGRLPSPLLRLAHLREALGAAEAAVGGADSQQPSRRRRGSAAAAADCTYGAIRAADVGALVPVDPEPPQRAEDLVERPGDLRASGRCLRGGQEDAAGVAREQPAPASPGGYSDVRIAGGRRGVADAHGPRGRRRRRRGFGRHAAIFRGSWDYLAGRHRFDARRMAARSSRSRCACRREAAPRIRAMPRWRRA